MKPRETIAALADKFKGTKRELSKALGRSDNWISSTITNGGPPKVDTLANIADVVGVDVCLVDRATGETIATIDPPRRGEG